MIKLLQVGLGPLGIKTFEYITGRKSLQTIAAVDINPSLAGRKLSELVEGQENEVIIKSSLEEVDNINEVDAVVLTTSSSIKSIAPQIQQIVEYGLPIVSTCEELCYPWKNDPELADALDAKAKKHNVAVVSTGVNPGFLMDSLPSFLSSVCQEINHVEVRRIQDATHRRIPFQKKIGAGLTLDQFDQKKKEGTLRHVGLTESMQFIADSVGWKIDFTEDVISPIVAESIVETKDIRIDSGMAMGVKQIGRAEYNGIERVKLVFEAAVGTGVSYDEVRITGKPNLVSRIEGGVNGDIATCSIILNAIPNVLSASPGLKTMKDLSLVSFVQ